MIVTYWGVRGSMPVPGPATVRYGGNTSCVSIRRGDSLLVLDAGTGVVTLGERLEPEIREILILLTHRHMDHVHGLPFFGPLYDDRPVVGLLDVPVASGCWTPLSLFDGITVPMRPERFGKRVQRLEGDPLLLLRERGWNVERISLRHPGGSSGFRIREGDRTFAHLTDTEIGRKGEAGEFFQECVDFCGGAEVLSHDAQYLAAELDGRRGRGHSSVEGACDLAEAAGVGHLVLFHHDPGRSDAALDEIGRAAAARLQASGIGCSVAAEGLAIEI